MYVHESLRTVCVRESPHPLIPAQAGIQSLRKKPGFRREEPASSSAISSQPDAREPGFSLLRICPGWQSLDSRGRGNERTLRPKQC